MFYEYGPWSKYMACIRWKLGEIGTPI